MVEENNSFVQSNVRRRAIVVTYFDPQQPGFLDFSYRIHALNKEFSLTILGLGSLDKPELQAEGVQYHVLASGRGKIGWLRYLKNCGDFIRKVHPDLVVLLHSATTPVALLTGKIPTIVYWNEHPTNLIRILPGMSIPRKLLARCMHRLIYYSITKADLVMPIGEDHRDDLLAHGVDKKKLKMIYMGVADDFQSISSASDAPNKVNLRLIYTGTVSVRRGRDIMLGAMQLLSKENLPIHLTIVGASDDELAITQKKIIHDGLSDSVTICGRVCGRDIPKYLAEHDVGICIWEKNTAYEFNPPTKLFEYLVAGLPILASNIRTHRRYIDEGRNGWIFEYEPESLAGSIRQLLRDISNLPQYKYQAKTTGKTYLWSSIEPAFVATVNSVLR